MRILLKRLWTKQAFFVLFACLACSPCIFCGWLLFGAALQRQIDNALIPLPQRICLAQAPHAGELINRIADGSVATGYFENGAYYVLIVRPGAQGGCSVDFHEKIWNDKVEPNRVEKLYLSRDNNPLISVDVDYNDRGRLTAAKYMIFIKQKDGSYIKGFSDEFCAAINSHSATVNASPPPTLLLNNDYQCDEIPGQWQTFEEYSFWDNKPVLIQRWSTGRP